MSEIKTVRAKMVCNSVMPAWDGGKVAHLSAVYSNDPASENKAFSDATPSAYVQIAIAKDKPAGELFEPGRHYLVDFSLVEKAA